MSVRALVLAGVFGVTFGLAACAAPAEETTASASVAAFTVESGDRFVVSATPEKIVLKKSVDGVAFPFDEDSLKGKAVLIHPITTKGETGVYARVRTVTSSGQNYVIESTPLDLDEMSTISEDEIVRIYIDGKSRRARASTDGATLEPASLFVGTDGLRPSTMSVTGVAFTGFNFGGLDSSTPTFLRAGVMFNHTIDEARFEPEALVDYSRDTGLDLGFRTTFGWKSTLKLSGRVSGELVRSPEVKGPPLLFYVPIGFVPVPVWLTASAFITCSAIVSGVTEVTFDFDAHAKIGGSLRIKPSTKTSASDWVKEGSWPMEATGTASAKPTFGADVSAAIMCSLPRVEVHADIAGVAGPYLAMAPVAIMKPSEATYAVRLLGGVGAGFLGRSPSVEVILYSWEP